MCRGGEKFFSITKSHAGFREIHSATEFPSSPFFHATRMAFTVFDIDPRKNCFLAEWGLLNFHFDSDFPVGGKGVTWECGRGFSSPVSAKHVPEGTDAPRSESCSIRQKGNLSIEKSLNLRRCLASESGKLWRERELWKPGKSDGRSGLKTSSAIEKVPGPSPGAPGRLSLAL